MMLAGLNAETGDSFAAILPLFSNPRQADMLASRPEHLAKQAADMLRKAEESERDPEGRPSGQAVQFALQACILQLHQAAVLAERRRSVDKRWAFHVIGPFCAPGQALQSIKA